MKITNKNTWMGVPIIIFGLGIWIAALVLLFTKTQAKWVDIVAAGGDKPSWLFAIVISAVVGGIVGALVYIGFSISKWHGSLDDGKAIEFKILDGLTKSGFFTMAGFIVGNLIIFGIWRGDL